MIQFKLTKDIDRTYDRIFAILGKKSFLFESSTKDEYEVEDGYVIVFHSIPDGAYEDIIKLKGVVEL